jgi:hypothetical protein
MQCGLGVPERCWSQNWGLKRRTFTIIDQQSDCFINKHTSEPVYDYVSKLRHMFGFDSTPADIFTVHQETEKVHLKSKENDKLLPVKIFCERHGQA